MSCDTCDHTMRHIDDNVLWCGRCGTIRVVEVDGTTSDEAPALVERCRKFEKTHDSNSIAQKWQRLGIAEAINTPENRPEGV